MMSLPNPNSTLEILNFQELYSKLLTLKNNIRDDILMKEQTVFVIQMGACACLWEREGGGEQSKPKRRGSLGCRGEIRENNNNITVRNFSSKINGSNQIQSR